MLNTGSSPGNPVSINVKYKSFSINVLELRKRKGKYNSQTIYLFKE
jgi:hypothetical protein